MCEHRPSFVGDVKNIAMAFPALLIREGRICLSPLQCMVVFAHVLGKMNKDIFYAVGGFRKEKIECVMWGREVTVHTVCDKTLGIIDVGGCFPGVEGKLNFMAGSTKLGGGCANHCVVGKAKQRESDQDAGANKYGPYEIFFHGRTLCCMMIFVSGIRTEIAVTNTSKNI